MVYQLVCKVNVHGLGVKIVFEWTGHSLGRQANVLTSGRPENKSVLCRDSRRKVTATRHRAS